MTTKKEQDVLESLLQQENALTDKTAQLEAQVSGLSAELGAAILEGKGSQPLHDRLAKLNAEKGGIDAALGAIVPRIEAAKLAIDAAVKAEKDAKISAANKEIFKLGVDLVKIKQREAEIHAAIIQANAKVKGNTWVTDNTNRLAKVLLWFDLLWSSRADVAEAAGLPELDAIRRMWGDPARVKF